MKTVSMIGIVLALTSAIVAQDTQPAEVYPAVTIEGGALTLDLPEDIKQAQVTTIPGSSMMTMRTE